MNQDWAKMMRDAQSSVLKMKQDMEKMQSELDQIMIEGTSGGGAVRIICNGNQIYKQVKISKDAVDPNDVETLEDLVLAALKDASTKAQNLMQTRANNLTAGMNLPPGLF